VRDTLLLVFSLNVALRVLGQLADYSDKEIFSAKHARRDVVTKKME
jgi:hypothetical protein